MEILPGSQFLNFELIKKIGDFGGKSNVWLANLKGTNFLFDLYIKDIEIRSSKPRGDQKLVLNDKNIVILKELGNGSYSSVYLIQEFENNKKYALKMYFEPEEGEKEYSMYKFLEGCPNLPKIYFGDYFFEKNQYFMCMKNMKDCVDGLKLSNQLINQIMRDISKALTFIHQKNIVHGDVKLKNILINDKNEAYLCDFTNSYNRNTILNEVGTSWYRSPENCDPRLKNYFIDFPCDIWSLGICYISMLNNGDIPKLFRVNNPHLLYPRISFQDYMDEYIEEFVNKIEVEDKFFTINLLQRMLCVEPDHRITAKEAFELLNK